MATYYNPYNTAMNYGGNGYPNYPMYGQPAQQMAQQIQGQGTVR